VQADRALTVLGTCLVVGLLSLVPLASSARATAIGSTCAHPWQADYRVGGPSGRFEGDQTLIRMGSSLGRIPRSVQWSVRAGYVICSARIQLADGHWVGPTRVNPYPTPTPIGGEYRAPQGPPSSLRTVIVTAARSPVRPGANCNYPLFSGFAVDGAASQKSDLKDFTVKYKLDRESNPGEPGEGALTTFHAEVIVTNPRIVMCRVVVKEFKGSGRSWPLPIGPHGGLSSKITLESRIGFSIAGYARLVK
jgi:hypothetical protein